MTTSVNDLVEVVRINFCQITPQEARELLELSDPIDKKMQLLHKKLLKSVSSHSGFAFKFWNSHKS